MVLSHAAGVRIPVGVPNIKSLPHLVGFLYYKLPIRLNCTSHVALVIGTRTGRSFRHVLPLPG